MYLPSVGSLRVSPCRTPEALGDLLAAASHAFPNVTTVQLPHEHCTGLIPVRYSFPRVTEVVTPWARLEDVSADAFPALKRVHVAWLVSGDTHPPDRIDATLRVKRAVTAHPRLEHLAVSCTRSMLSSDLAAMLHNLTSLDMSHCSLHAPAALVRLASLPARLTNLDLSFAVALDSAQAEIDALAAAPWTRTLRRLTLRGVCSRNLAGCVVPSPIGIAGTGLARFLFLAHMPALEELDIGSTRSSCTVEESCVFAALRSAAVEGRMPSLRDLDLTDTLYSSFPKRELDIIADLAFPNLSVLTLSGNSLNCCDARVVNCAAAVAAASPSLRILSLADCGLRDGAAIARTLEPGGALRHLDILDLADNQLDATALVWALTASRGGPTVLWHGNPAGANFRALADRLVSAPL
jgi:hypothetical protein